MATVRRPRLQRPWNWAQTEGRYKYYDPRQVIEGYLLRDPHKYCWDGRGGFTTPIPLTHCIPYWKKDAYPFANCHGYWFAKIPENLTEDDKSYLRWLIRQGRVSDAPTKDPGIYEMPKKEKSKKRLTT